MGMFTENYSGLRCCDCTWADNAELRIKDLESKLITWIKVSDRLPERNVEVLTFDPDEVYPPDSRNSGSNGINMDYYGYHFRDSNDNKYDSFCTPGVTHWAEMIKGPTMD